VIEWKVWLHGLILESDSKKRRQALFICVTYRSPWPCGKLMVTEGEYRCLVWWILTTRFAPMPESASGAVCCFVFCRRLERISGSWTVFNTPQGKTCEIGLIQLVRTIVSYLCMIVLTFERWFSTSPIRRRKDGIPSFSEPPHNSGCHPSVRRSVFGVSGSFQWSWPGNIDWTWLYWAVYLASLACRCTNTIKIRLKIVWASIY
jgi:hypothetical protein